MGPDGGLACIPRKRGKFGVDYPLKCINSKCHSIKGRQICPLDSVPVKARIRMASPGKGVTVKRGGNVAFVFWLSIRSENQREHLVVCEKPCSGPSYAEHAETCMCRRPTCRESGVIVQCLCVSLSASISPEPFIIFKKFYACVFFFRLFHKNFHGR